jgi:predicted Zn-dependent protease
MITASTTADDGAELHRFEAFDVASPDRLPADPEVAAKIDTVIADLRALKAAPVIDPYSGPAILEGKAAGVFFHEVFGHRIEGHRQKSDAEGQTFAKMIDKRITASFLDVFDDPSIASLNGIDLNGFYRYDDEGIPGQRASLVEAGVLKAFLLGRSPTRGFVHSNGHGRRQSGRSVVSRQGNLVARASHAVDPATLKAMLLDEVKKQGKPFGMIIKELDGGFTMTERFSPQAFKLLPVMVYRVYPDGREELVRGADLEGTPLAALADIRAAGSDVETFNGFCGAESGFVPVSASSPSLLVAHLEVAKKATGKTKPPILPPPPRGGEK